MTFPSKTEAWIAGWRDALFGLQARQFDGQDFGQNYEAGYIIGWTDRKSIPLETIIRLKEHLKWPSSTSSECASDHQPTKSSPYSRPATK